MSSQLFDDDGDEASSAQPPDPTVMLIAGDVFYGSPTAVQRRQSDFEGGNLRLFDRRNKSNAKICPITTEEKGLHPRCGGNNCLVWWDFPGDPIFVYYVTLPIRAVGYKHDNIDAAIQYIEDHYGHMPLTAAWRSKWINSIALPP